MKKWYRKLRRCIVDGLPTSNNRTSLQQNDMDIQEKTWPHAQEKFVKNASKLRSKNATSESKDVKLVAHVIIECVDAEIHALLWMTASPLYLEIRYDLPFHCDMVLTLRRLLYFTEKEMSKHSEKSAELHTLSWMTSPSYLQIRYALPFHCDMVFRLGRLLYFADKELSK